MSDSTTTPTVRPGTEAVAETAPPSVSSVFTEASPTPEVKTEGSGEQPSNLLTTAITTTVKRPRSAESVTQHLHAPSVSDSAAGSSASFPNETEAMPVPPKLPRMESHVSPVSPYANLPRKMVRKTPVSTPTSSVGTPPLVSPATTVTPPTPSQPKGPVLAAAKLTALHDRWANLLHGLFMKERAPHEAESVRALSLRIVESIPGTLEETKDSFQTLLLSLKDSKNGELRRRVVEGELLVETLVRMDDRELANPELRKQIEERMEDRAKDTNLSELAKAHRTSNSTLFKCHVCGARDTSWFQQQTRSGDEPMTVIITCNRCNTQWRKY